jgi:transposase
MARALSNDLRSRVLAASDDGISARSAAERFGIDVSTAIAWIASACQGRRSAAKQGRPDGSLDAHEALIVGLIDKTKDITLNEMVLRLAEDKVIRIGRSALDVWLRKRGWTFKKRPHTHSSRNGADLLKRRREWFDAQLDLDPSKLVFIDETDISTKMAGCADVLHAANGADLACRMDIGKQRL